MSDPMLAAKRAKGEPSTARTTVLTFSSVLGGAVLAFATALYLGNQVGEAGAGIFFQIMAFFSIVVVASTFGADTGLVRNLAAQRVLGTRKNLQRTIVIAGLPVLLLSMLLGLVLWVNAESLEQSAHVPGLAAAIRLAAPLLVPAAIMNVAFGAMRGLGQVASFSAIQNLLLPTLRFGAVALAILLGGTLLQLTAAWTLPVLLGVSLACVATWLSIRGFHPVGANVLVGTGTPNDPQVSFWSFWGFSSARGMSALVETTLEWVDVIAVAVFMGPAAAGIYGAVNRCVRMGVMLEHTARLVTGPMLSACLAIGNHSEARRLFNDTAKLLVGCAWPFYLTLGIFGQTVLSLFGSGFSAGAVPLAIISIVMMLAVSAGGVQSMLLMGGKSRWQLGNKACALSAALILNLLLVPLWGLLGAVTAWSVAILVDCSLATLQVARVMGFGAPVRELLPLAGICLIVFGAGGLAWRIVLGPTLLAAGLQLAIGMPIYLMLCIRFGKRLGLEELLAQLLQTFRKARPKTENPVR
ncbi:lipopolysaccharide biosynthesis protein [Arthrobacter sp. MYb227]|uniref:lipopolysaccharide biosynthesis protein n=1 Tax=Arthrobacter sp. MYb227 TaxID=1848601 RepID=UPI0015E3310A|nr:lipopolysaccharide biosynthesis protein [Arthrobacter sp. MYb227]